MSKRREHQRVQYRTAQCSAAQHSAVQYSTAQYSTVQNRTVQQLLRHDSSTASTADEVLAVDTVPIQKTDIGSALPCLPLGRLTPHQFLSPLPASSCLSFSLFHFHPFSPLSFHLLPFPPLSFHFLFPFISSLLFAVLYPLPKCATFLSISHYHRHAKQSNVTRIKVTRRLSLSEIIGGSRVHPDTQNG